MNPVPKRVPVITVVGDPIMCPLIPDPSPADIDKVAANLTTTLSTVYVYLYAQGVVWHVYILLNHADTLPTFSNTSVIRCEFCMCRS